jgi:acyl-CoA thioesterase-1
MKLGSMKRMLAWLWRARSYGVVRVARQHGLFGIDAFALAIGILALTHGVGAAAPDRTLRIVALGDSLTAGFGLPQSAAFPAVLERALKARGHRVEIVNAGVSGDTASGGLERLDWSVPDGTDAVILELGANDMLRGIDPAVTKQALEAIVSRLKARGIRVMLAGMYASRNLGPDYAQRFDAVYRDIASQHGLVFYPFFLEGVAGQRQLNMQDGLHPTAQGVEMIVRRMLPTVESFVKGLSQ